MLLQVVIHRILPWSEKEGKEGRKASEFEGIKILIGRKFEAVFFHRPCFFTYVLVLHGSMPSPAYMLSE